MIILDIILQLGLSFIFLCAVFRPLEYAFPAKPNQPFFRPDWFTDLCFMLGQYLVWIGLVYATVNYTGGWITTIMPTSFREAVAAQPWFLQAIEVVILSDFFIYWGHRLQHKVDFLWRFHSIHHTSEHLDWLAAHREHPLDSLYTIGLVNLPAFLLGFPMETIVGLIAFRGIWAIYIHSNVRIPLGVFGNIVGSPQLHHWHHAKDRDVGNYANISPLMDIIFGTHYCPDHEPETLGINEPSPRHYIGHMLHPFKSRKRLSNLTPADTAMPTFQTSQ